MSISPEHQIQQEGFQHVIGVDEAGRGPLVGPVVAAAVCLKTFEFDTNIRDSKKLSPKRREEAFVEISDKAYVGFGIMSESVIDAVNILEATYMAMNNAVRQLISVMPADPALRTKSCLLIDGNRFKSDQPVAYRTIVKGDSKVQSIAAASIMAKVMRDRIIGVYDQIFPEYGFKQHKGYGTKAHKEAIAKHGPSPIQRHSFSYS